MDAPHSSAEQPARISPDATLPPREAAMRRLFTWVLVAFLTLVPASLIIPYVMLQHGPRQAESATHIRPPVSFEAARIGSRLDRLEYELHEFAVQPDVNPKDAARELEELRVRSETVGTRQEVRKVAEDTDAWERKYLMAR